MRASALCLFAALAALRLASGLGDLPLVGLKPGARLGVLTLPFLALGIESFEPFAGLWVETVGVDVVALLIVGGWHPVEGWVEVLASDLTDRALVRLLQRQTDPAPVEIDVDDLYEDLVAHLDDLFGDLDMPVGELGDMNEALDALLDPDERAERNQLGDPARDDLPDLMHPRKLLPGVFLRRLQRQRDPLAVHIDVEHL